MKKLIFALSLFFVYCQLSAEFIWEEPAWVVPVYMIHSENYLIAENDESFYFVWVASEESTAQIKAIRYSFAGQQQWSASRQLGECETFPLLRSAISDAAGNLMVVYETMGTNNPVHLAKYDTEGELIWESTDFVIEGDICDIELKNGDNGGVYLNIGIDTYSSTEYNEIYYLENDGEIAQGWENGTGIGNMRDWEIDIEGNLLVVYCTLDYDFCVRGYTISGEDLFTSEVITLDDDYIHNWFSYVENLEVVDSGYLISSSESSYFISDAGELIWELEKSELYGSSFRNMRAGTNCFYEVSDNGYLYKFNYNPELVWSTNIFLEDDEIPNAWILANGNYRYLLHQYDYVDDREYFALMEYSAEGEIVCPATGWCADDCFWGFDKIKVQMSAEDNTVWGIMEQGDDFWRTLGMKIISSEGEVITGDDTVIIDTGYDKLLIPEMVFIAEESENILMEDSSVIAGNYSFSSLKYQSMDRAGNPVNSDYPELVLQGELEKIGENENSVVYLTRNNNQIHQIDMSCGELMWGDNGFDIEYTGEIIEAAADFVAGGVVIFWEDTEGFKAQYFADGAAVWDEEIQITGIESAEHYVAIAGNYLINILDNQDLYYITHYNDAGQIDWSQQAGYEVNILIGKHYLSTEQGLLYIQRAGFSNYLDINIQLLSHEGDYLYGSEGVELSNVSYDKILGFIGLDDGYAYIRYNYFGETPAYYASYNMDGSQMHPEIELAGTDHCRIADAKVVEDGLIVAIVEYHDDFHDQKIGYYGFNGQLLTTVGDNPVTAYTDYASPYNYAGALYDGVYYSAIQSYQNARWNSYLEGTDVLLNGWEIPQTNCSDQEIPQTSAVLQINPNPFNPQVNICWFIGGLQQDCSLEIYNIKGQRVFHQDFAAHRNEFIWNCRDDSGSLCSSGIYFFKLHTPQKSYYQKGLLLK